MSFTIRNYYHLGCIIKEYIIINIVNSRNIDSMDNNDTNIEDLVY